MPSYFRNVPGGRVLTGDVCRVGIVIALTWLLSGCAWFQTPPDRPLAEANAEQLTELLREREAAMQTMKGLFRAQIKGPGILIPQRVEGVMYYSRPDLLRLRAFTHVGSELFELAMNADSYRLRLPTTGQQFTGRIDELNRMKDFGRSLQLSAKAVTEVAAIGSITDRDRVELALDQDRYRMDVLRLVSVDGVVQERVLRRLWFDRGSLHVVREDFLTLTGELDGSMEFDDFRMTGATTPNTASTVPGRTDSLERPFKITARDGKGSGSLVLTFHEIVSNPVFKPEELQAPGT